MAAHFFVSGFCSRSGAGLEAGGQAMLDPILLYNHGPRPPGARPTRPDPIDARPDPTRWP